MLLQRKTEEMNLQIKKLEEKDNETVQLLLKSEEESKKLLKRIMILENTLIEQENKVKEEGQAKEKEVEERKRLERVEEELNGRIKLALRDYAAKMK